MHRNPREMIMNNCNDDGEAQCVESRIMITVPMSHPTVTHSIVHDCVVLSKRRVQTIGAIDKMFTPSIFL